MHAAVVIGLVALLISGGHCRPQKTSPALLGALEAVQFLTTSSIEKRQTTVPAYTTCITNGLQNFLATYPQDCASQFSAALGLTTGGSVNQDAIIATYRLICQPRCGDPFIEFYNRCNAPRDLIDSVRGACARNSAGRLCYELFGNLLTDLTRVSTNCNMQSTTACSSECQNALSTFGSNSGCCINIINTTTFNSISSFSTFQYNLWSGCGVNTPGFCNLETSSLSSAKVPIFVKTFFLLTLIVMAMLTV